MGQEASLPQDNGDSLEDQARSPPSSINPPVHGQGSVRPATKMIETMIHRAAQSVGHKDFEGKEAARAAAASGQMPFTSYGNEQAQQNLNAQRLAPEEQQHLSQHQHINHQHQQSQQSQEPLHHHEDPNHNPQPHPLTSQNNSAHPLSSTGNGFYATAVKSGRGKGLIKSMKGISISNTIRSGVQATAHVAAVTATATANAVSATAAVVNANVIKSTKGGVSEWETRWDEDDDSEGEEDENDTGHGIASIHGQLQQHQPQQHHQITQQQHHSPMKPGIDSSASPAGTTACAPVTPVKCLEQGANAVNNDLADDGIEWDTGAQQDVASKPNVQMFLPLLRVLGKGSFGKVSPVNCCCDERWEYGLILIFLILFAYDRLF